MAQYILPDMGEYKASKESSVLITKKRYYWDWLNAVKDDRLPVTATEVATRLGVTRETLNIWKKEWIRAKRVTTIQELQAVPEDIQRMFLEKVSNISPSIQNELASMDKSSSKEAMKDLSSLVLIFSLMKGSSKLMEHIDTVTDPEKLVKVLDKIMDVVVRLNTMATTLNSKSNDGNVILEKKATIPAHLMQGMKLPQNQEEQPSPIKNLKFSKVYEENTNASEIIVDAEPVSVDTDESSGEG